MIFIVKCLKNSFTYKIKKLDNFIKIQLYAL